jgi:hypothetical protein
VADVTTTVRAIVTVVDKATAPLRAISSQFRAFGSGLGGAHRNLKELGNAAPMYRLGAALHGVSEAGKKTFANLKRIAEPLLALGGVALIGGLAESLHHFAEQSEGLHKLALNTGDTVEHLQELDHWATTSGGSADALHTAMGRVNKLIGAAEHGNKAAIQTFKGLKIAFDDGKGHGRTFGDMAGELVNRFSRMRTASERAFWGQRLFTKAWQETVPLLAQGSARYREATDEARRHGLLTDDNVKAGLRLARAQINLQDAIRGTVNAISARLAPILTRLIKDWTKWLDKNREWVAKTTVDKILSIAKAFQSFARDVGGAKHAIEIFMAVAGTIAFAPILASLATLAREFYNVAKAAGLLDLLIAPEALIVGGAILLILATLYLLNRYWPQIAAAGKAAFAALGKAIDWTYDHIAAGLTAVAVWLKAKWSALWAWFASTDAGKALIKVWDDFAPAAKKAFAEVIDAITRMWATIRQGLPTWLGGTVAPPAIDASALAAAAGAVRPGDADNSGSVGGAVLGRLGAGDMKPSGAGSAGGDVLGRLAAAGAGAPGAAGRVDVVITAPNQPPGTRVGVKTTGKNLTSRADVGHSMPQLVPAGG